MNPITPVITINITSFESTKLYREDNVIIIGGVSEPLEKQWAVAFAFFQKFANFLNAHNSKNICQKQLKLSRASICTR